uniref:Uncharacterized protein n=1 Tax=Arundo donax TaxID=35708 RepID=A0A0A9AYX2_ARUDO
MLTRSAGRSRCLCVSFMSWCVNCGRDLLNNSCGLCYHPAIIVFW